MTRYKKHGYFQENDNFVSRGCLYDLGPGYDERVGEESDLQRVLLSNITTDVCLDLNLGVRKERALWKNPECDHESSLHLIQSNSIDPFWDVRNFSNLPERVGVLHADKYPYPSWCPPTVPRPQDVYCPYRDGSVSKDDLVGCKVEFHLRFSGNDYRFVFLKLI